MSKSKGTYLVEFANGDKYIFGNNYKDWWYHVIELQLTRERKNVDVTNRTPFKRVMYSDTPFVDDGGLKFCISTDYQQIIDEVAVKTETELKPFNEYQFAIDRDALVKLDKEWKRF